MSPSPLAPYSPSSSPADGLAVIRYTAGTTGPAKGVMLTHRNLIAGAVQGAAWRRESEDGRRRYWASLPRIHADVYRNPRDPVPNPYAGPDADVLAAAGYGLAEAPPLALARPFAGKSKPGSIGIPLPDTEARIVGDDGLEPLAPGEVGELVLKGPQVMAGYWGRPEESARALREGWLRHRRFGDDGRGRILFLDRAQTRPGDGWRTRRLSGGD